MEIWKCCQILRGYLVGTDDECDGMTGVHETTAARHGRVVCSAEE